MKDEATIEIEGTLFSVHGDIVREVGTPRLYDAGSESGYMMHRGQRISLMSFEDFGVYPACIKAVENWKRKARMAHWMVTHDRD